MGDSNQEPRLREEKKQGTWAERRPCRWEQMRAREERRTRGRVFLWCLIENKGARNRDGLDTMY